MESPGSPNLPETPRTSDPESPERRRAEFSFALESLATRSGDDPMDSSALSSSLFSLLEEGEMLRFSARIGESGVGMMIEGAGTFQHRLGALLERSRAAGYGFGECIRLPEAVAKHEMCPRPVATAGPRWLTIRPVAREAGAPAPDPIGFRPTFSSPETSSRRDFLALPAFGRGRHRDMLQGLTGVLDEMPGLLCIEIDVEKIRLEPEQIQMLEATSRHLVPPAPPTGPGEAESDDLLLARYVSMWLRRRAGWRMRCRALAIGRENRAALEAILSLAGEGLFGTRCEIQETGTKPGVPKRESGENTLLGTYPEGWPVPALLPPLNAEDDRGPIPVLHNRTRPQLPSEGTLIGFAENLPVRLPVASKSTHTYLVGATGTGKSTLMLQLIEDDLRRGESVILLDPHGDLVRAVREMLPARRSRKIVVIDPTEEAKPPGLNVFDIPRDRLHRRSVDFLIGELLSFFHDTWEGCDAFGPMFESYYRNTMLLLANPPAGRTLTLADFSKVLTSKSLREELLDVCPDPLVKDFWTEVAAKAGGEASLSNIAPYIACKVGPLVQAAFLSEMLGHPRDELQLGKRMDGGGIVLVNLDKGVLGPVQSRLLGTLLAVQIFSAGLRRSQRPADQRAPVNVYIDEFQNFVSGNLASMLSEARKFGLRLILANQTLDQLESRKGGAKLTDTVLGNVGNLFLFRLGVSDSTRLAPFCAPSSARKMQFLPNHHALARLMDGGRPLPPFVFETRKPQPPVRRRK